MLATSQFLLWISVILLGVAVLALDRQVRVLRQGGAALVHGPAVADTMPLISTPTLAGEMMTLGGATRDGRALLLLFLQADCIVSAQMLRDALALCDPARVRLIVLGESDAGFGELTRPHRVRDADIILSAGIGAEMGVVHWPAATLIAGDGSVLGRGGVRRRDQIETLLALLPPAPGSEIRSIA
jgi:methylamine dehydrogenase accessory protein MauD